MVSAKFIFRTVLNAALVSAQTYISIEDYGTPTSCGQSVCCIPSCQVEIGNIDNCQKGVAKYAGSCSQDSIRTDQIVDVDNIENCDGWSMNWNASFIYVSYKPNGNYVPFAVGNCQNATPEGQCAYSGGGCDGQETF